MDACGTIGISALVIAASVGKLMDTRGAAIVTEGGGAMAVSVTVAPDLGSWAQVEPIRNWKNCNSGGGSNSTAIPIPPNSLGQFQSKTKNIS